MFLEMEVSKGMGERDHPSALVSGRVPQVHNHSSRFHLSVLLYNLKVMISEIIFMMVLLKLKKKLFYFCLVVCFKINVKICLYFEIFIWHIESFKKLLVHLNIVRSFLENKCFIFFLVFYVTNYRQVRFLSSTRKGKSA